MDIASYIINDVNPFVLKDGIKAVKSQFKKLTYTHIPVVEKKKLVGLISENDIRSFDVDKTIQDYQYTLANFFVTKQTHWVDVLETFAQNYTNILPILNDKGIYIGYYELIDIISFFTETPFLKELGAILIVEKGLKDYSFSEISQIVESNNGKVLGAFVSATNEETIQITLKIASVNLNEVIQTFRRYSYTIIFGNEEDTFLKNLKERSDYLKKYLNI